MTELRDRGYERQLKSRGDVRLGPRVGTVPDRCWFCDGTDGLSNEHIFARWLQKKFCAEDELFSPVHFDALGRPISDRGQIPARAFVAGNVCQTCNAGWMNDIETAFRVDLFDEHRTGVLEACTKLSIARWFAKTACVLNVSQNYRYLVPDATRRAVGRGLTLPEGLSVHLAVHEKWDAGGQFDFLQGLATVGVVPEEEVSAIKDALDLSFGCVVRVQELVGLVIAPPAGLVLAAVDMAQLWPDAEDVACWDNVPRVRSLAEANVVRVESFTSTDYLQPQINSSRE